MPASSTHAPNTPIGRYGAFCAGASSKHVRNDLAERDRGGTIMERQTWRRIQLGFVGLKVTGLLVYGAVHSMSGSGSLPDAGSTPPVIKGASNSMFATMNQLDKGIPMVGPHGENMLIRNPATGALEFVFVTPSPSATPAERTQLP
jgi:hypothetical protein